MKKNPTFGEFIRLTRKEKRGLPLVALSKQIGISPAQLQRIEENRVRIYPDEKFLEKVSKSLDVDYETLVDLLYHHKSKQLSMAYDLKEIPIVPWEFLSNIQNISPETIATGFMPIHSNSNELMVSVVCKTSKWQPFIAELDVIVLTINTYPVHGNTILTVNEDGEYGLYKVAESSSGLCFFSAFPAFQSSQDLTSSINRDVVGVVDRVVRSFK